MNLHINARFLTQSFSGVQRYGLEISRQIRRLCPEAVFVAPQGPIHKEMARELDVRIVGRGRGYVWEQVFLPHYLSQVGHPPLFCPGNMAPFRYRNCFVTIHDLAYLFAPETLSQSFRRAYRFFIPRIYRSARHVFAVSQTVAGELQQHFGSGTPVSVTYNGISENLAGGNRQHPKEKILLTVGSANKRKNHERLISAFAQSALNTEYRLVIIGGQHKIFREGDNIFPAGVEMYQGLSNEELMSWYQRAELFVSLSTYEGFGIPVLEGLYFGCNVLCADIPVYRELFEDCVYFCPPEDTAEIIKSMETVTGSSRLNTCPEHLFEQYNFERSARHILDSISATLASAGEL